MSIVFDSTVVLAHAIEPGEAHRVMGELLLNSAAHCVDLPPEFVDRFRADWAAQLPLLMAAAETTVGEALGLGPPLLERRPEFVARVAGEAARLAHVGPGVIQGRDAVAFITQVYCPASLAEARRRLGDFDRHELLRLTAFELDRTLMWRQRLTRTAVLGHHAPWESDFDPDQLAEVVRHARALQLLAELIAAADRTLGLVPDHLDWIEIASLVDAALFAAVAADHGRLELAEVAGVVAGAYAGVTLGVPLVDLAGFQAARAAHHARPGRWDPRTQTLEAIARGVGPNDFVSFVDLEVPALWRDLDEALRDATGASFDCITAVLGTAAAWDVTAEGPAALVDRGLLVEQAAEWADLDVESVDAAVRLLTFDAERAAASPPDYWRLEERPQRLATRPLVAADDVRLWVMPAAVRSTQDLCFTYLQDGRLPWPDLPPSVHTPIRTLRLAMDNEHESRVAEVCRELGFVVRARLTPKKARRLGVDWPDSVGEFDVLAADLARSRIWVLEAKNPVRAVSAWHLTDAVDDFHGPRGHVVKLRRRVEAAAADPSATAGVLGCGQRQWSVRGAMVTADIEIAAFTTDPRVTYVTVDDLADMLLSDGPFPPGQWAVGVA